ncbi:MAG: S53 family serine peptidase, partial [Formivibrio sp.]|nr:S53 family serine peptidase [Formivibrio sp.]
TNVLHLAIGLPLRNQDQLNALLQQVSDPSSPNYRHYLTGEEFTSQFGATEEDSQAVINFAKANALTVTRVHGNRMLIEVDGKAADIGRAFNVSFHTYHLAAENRDFYAPDQEPTVAASLPILDVQGLNNYVRPRPRIHFGPVKKSTRLGSGPFGTYLGNDFRAAYVPGTPLNGAGEKVALFEYDGYLASDISLYEQRAGLSAVGLTNILLQGSTGAPFDPNAQGEVTLDIDMVIAMAPSISQILVYEGNLQAAYLPNLVLNQIAADNSAHQVSCSWGWSGGPSSTTDQIFQQMILQGQSFFDASGDVCAFLPPGSAGSVDDPTLDNAPSDDPYITQVGATTLQTTGPVGSFVSESVWNWGLEFPGQGLDGVGSSGGISGYYSIPAWQQGISMTNNQGSTTMRNLPDVALTGDNIFIIENGLDQDGVAGTSCAAPLWAGFIALVNQQAAAHGLGVVGFINPAIYAIAKTAAYTNCFRDVVAGNNTWSQSTNEFFAVPGFDLCAGLGSPNGTNLINALATTSNAPVVYTPVIPAPKQPWGNTLSVMNGSDPNGLWFLYYQDDKLNNYSGTNYNG